MTRMRRLVRPMALITALVVAVGIGAGAPAFAAEQRQVVVKGKHMTFGGLAQTGAVTFLARSDESGGTTGKVGGSGKGKGGGSWLPSQEPWWERALTMLTDGLAYANSGSGKGKGGSNTNFNVYGESASYNRVDGRNYDLNGNLTGSGDKPGIALDVDLSYLATSNVSVSGSPATQANISPSVDVGSYVTFLSARANTTYTSNTTLTDQTIGGTNNYQIVVVKDCKLTLKGASTGYGVLVVYDSTATGGNAKLELEDTSKWYGVILFYSGNSSSNDQRFALGKHSGDCSSGGGSGKGKGGSWLPSQTPWWQRALTMLSGERSAFADDSSGKGKGASSCAAGSGVQVIGAVIARGYQFKISAPTGGLYDIFYSSTAVNNVDNMLGNTKFTWEKWRER